MSKINELHIFALAAYGEGISGGDRISIELARRWSKKFPIEIYLWTEGYNMFKKQNLHGRKRKKKEMDHGKRRKGKTILGIAYHVLQINFWCKLGFFACYIVRIIEGIRLGLTLTLENKKTTYLYNSSEFWMDSLPCVLLKIRYPKVRWIASWYQTAPSPVIGYVEKGARSQKHFIRAFFYWMVQLPIKPLINKWANKVIVNNEAEKQRFSEMDKRGDVVVLIGAVPLDQIEKYLSSHHPQPTPKYDAVFQGRFHPQKGVVELIDMWKRVVDKLPNAKLAMIGDGPLMDSVKARIKDKKLDGNVKLFGYVFDGTKKYSIFQRSKIVVHPSFYDSGGMASAEAMAFSLPCVGFDLVAYKSYYPKGMIKVKKGDLNAFSKRIIKLIENTSYRKRVGKEAYLMIKNNWSWDLRAEQIYSVITR